ncbi:hypothetical protein H310_09353 [Aphanomyces invadans]|uniref:Uncharacterized protein n=1 Tax=Aphanomyces invadans TaxID=157072 RepID=A0A024TVP9_9STRA|nr:hypothetical protein H310_09353 [Aphanomyces invadans]ETV98064.1 hypothetical protein H310_09353 [Aphanomyces invadans]|eukprot:XP_008873625.1 hypothetical protein H310_09353 [Aphanomyces invadans]
MGKKKELEVKDIKKTERAAVASGKDTQLNKNVLKREKSSQVQKVDFSSIHYLDQPDCENLDAIRTSLIEKVQAAKSVNERVRRDLDCINSRCNSERIKCVLDELSRLQAHFTFWTEFLTEGIDGVLHPQIEEEKPKSPEWFKLN